ncbi:MAG TPA: DUF4912 domain-containing protein [Polyangiaceae bacterium]|jgi:hypothetical protein|nr:MAG: hypothetical protein BWY17_00856 [Deltaproteobacteria bacterium ADurb.Bin207]HNS96261.1 DUF4912 domain-containing protein [Polyangiaceae bacterium]HNZ20731.1 DUF4912 domain-containing protein [Polyangiaceae bacterium]HOD20654.1 DUF4912 domain-containing protein [Polyangiaceae bacterium]HOE49148.1 DUF4912 domain-containing protein [Polyangiaceae bacterium]
MTRNKPNGLRVGQEPSHNGTHPARDHDVDRGAHASGKAKFDLGVGNGWFPSEDIPWGYGENRITAMARDPDWLYVYWEVTDDAIDQARQRLGRGAHDTWCCLRVYDTSGRDFDGCNALSYFDIAIERTTRDWFVHVGKPRSSCHVEVGIKSRLGDFQPMARSGRTDFPRKRPVEEVSVEWLTVEDEPSKQASLPASAAYVSRYSGPAPDIPVPLQPPYSDAYPRSSGATRVIMERHVERQEIQSRTWSERKVFRWFSRASRRFEITPPRSSIPWMTESWRTEWQGDERAFEWIRPLHNVAWSREQVLTTWDWAPYPGDSAAPGRVLVRFLGVDYTYMDSGFEKESAGSWEIVIHGASFGTSFRRVLGTWRLHRAQTIESVVERWESIVERIWHEGFVRERTWTGASEMRQDVEQGASERWILGGSERISYAIEEQLALGGSEWIWLGASELRLAGASERVTEWQFAGLGASEWVLEQGSERVFIGASEQLRMGASEQLRMGASESSWQASEVFAQASESFLHDYGGASESEKRKWWVDLGGSIGASELLGMRESTRFIKPTLPFAGASEQTALGSALMPHPPSQDTISDSVSMAELGIHALAFDDRSWTAVGASERVAQATYPATLDDDDENESSKGGG